MAAGDSQARVSTIEIIAFLLGLANVGLIVRRSLWNYPFGIAMVILYARVFWDAKLYSDAGLQIFFLVVQIYGWWAWISDTSADGEIIVERLSVQARVYWFTGCIAATLIWGTLMSQTDASFPYWDASVAMISVAAQLLMTRRYVENWMGWIVVDLLAIGLYASKALYLTAGLYAVFLLMAIWGLVEWQRIAARQTGKA